MSGSRQADVDAACATGPEDDAPIKQATVEERVLLTQDRGPPRRLTSIPGKLADPLSLASSSSMTRTDARTSTSLSE